MADDKKVIVEKDVYKEKMKENAKDAALIKYIKETKEKFKKRNSEGTKKGLKDKLNKASKKKTSN